MHIPYPYKLHEKAFSEFIQAYEWYEGQRAGLGDEFMNRVERRLTQISNNPEYYSVLRLNYRQAAVRGFPFTIIYEFFPRRKFIHICAIHHSSRHPRARFRKEEK